MSTKPAKSPADMPPHKCGHYGHKNKRGEPCGQSVPKGTKHCFGHARKPKAQHQAEGLARIEFTKWTLDGHDGADIDPRVEILRLIAFWKWRCNLYGTLLGQAYEAAERLKKAFAAQDITVAGEQTEVDDRGHDIPEHPEVQVARSDLERVFAQGGVSALVGHKYDADRSGRVYAVDEGVRALTELERKAHEMVAKMCALAIQAKVAQAKIDLAKQVGVMIQVVITGVLAELGVKAAEDRVWEAIVRHMDLVSSDPIEVTV